MPKIKILSVFVCAMALIFSVKSWADPTTPENKSNEFLNLTVSTTNMCVDASLGQSCVPSGLPSRLSEYLSCSSRAERYLLSRATAIDCMQAYLAVKLSFIAGVDVATFGQLTLQEQSEINRRAYQTYLVWRREYRPLPM